MPMSPSPVRAGETPEEIFERGKLAGEINARLAGHDQHFLTLNGNIKDLAAEMHDMNIAIQLQAEQAKARDVTALATAAALEAREKQRREATDERWSPVQKGLALFGALYGALTTAISIGLALYVALHRA